VRQHDDRIVAIRTRFGEKEDLILDARRGRIDPTNLPGLDGGVGVVRRRGGGALTALVLVGGSKLDVDGFALQVAAPRHAAKIESIDDDAGTFRVTPPLPVAAIGSPIRVTNPNYSHGSLYGVGDITTEGAVRVRDSELSLGRGRVDAVNGDTITTTAPLVFGFLYGRSTRFLDGKRIVFDGQAGTIAAQTGFKDVKVSGVTPGAGAEFVVYDVQVGDAVEMDAAASLAEDQGEWVLRANASVTVRFPFAVERATGDAWVAAGEQASVESLELSAGPVKFRRAK
jgi:hypothetical protein